MSNNKPIDPRSSLLGREAVFHASEEISKLMIRRFAAATDDYNPLYWDEQYAEKSRYGGIIAPPTLIFEITHDIGGGMNEEGSVKGFRSWYHPLRGTQRTGNEYEIFQTARPDDILTLRRKIVDVTEKEGKTGKWFFVTTETTYTNQRGELLGVDRETVAGRPD